MNQVSLVIDVIVLVVDFTIGIHTFILIRVFLALDSEAAIASFNAFLTSILLSIFSYEICESMAFKIVLSSSVLNL